MSRIVVESRETKERQKRKKISKIVSWTFPTFLFLMGAARLLNAATGLGDSMEAELIGGFMFVVMGTLFLPLSFMPRSLRLKVTDFRSMVFFLCVMGATFLAVYMLA